MVFSEVRDLGGSKKKIETWKYITENYVQHTATLQEF